MIKYGFNEDITVCKVKVEYTQPDDCEGNPENSQTLILESVDNGCGPFIRMSIPQGENEVGYWSIDGIGNLKEIIDDFEEKVNFHEENMASKDNEPFTAKLRNQLTPLLNLTTLHLNKIEIEEKRWEEAKNSVTEILKLIAEEELKK